MEVNNLHLCIGCMRELHNMDVCQHCGLVQKDYVPAPRCLIPGTRLSNRYVLGKILGEGSFGITYIGWDEVLAFPVAIKEYYPSDLVSRDVIRGNDTDVYMYANIEEAEYHKKLERFLKEARDLTRFNKLNAIVSVRDFFYENNTAYIVMDYIRGESLKSYVKREGAIDAGKVLEIFQPVLESLMKVHEVGIIHRDISPDNLLFDENHNLVLIDFGSAELQNADLTRSVTIMFKRGFSPEEQYRSCGKQGAWTDIYALCATMYYAMTTAIPDEAIQRTIEDRVTPLWDMANIHLTNSQMKAIMKGLKIRAEERYQKVSDLYEILYKKDTKEIPVKTRLSSGYIVAVVVVVLGILIAGGYLLQYFQNGHDMQSNMEGQIAVTEDITDSEEPANQTKQSEKPVSETKQATEKTTETKQTTEIKQTTESKTTTEAKQTTETTTEAKQTTETKRVTKTPQTTQSNKKTEELDGYIP